VVGVLKVSVQGALPGGEVWSVNPIWDLPTGDFPLTFAQLNAIATALNAVTIPAGLRSMWSTSTTATGVRLEHRSLGGELLSQIEQVRTTPVAGSGSTPHSFQSCVVSSLRTATAGASGRGRLYWPATGAALAAADLRLSSVDVDTFLLSVKTYLSSLQAAIVTTSAGANLSVWSRTRGAVYPINRVLMGNITDVQRRRRDTAVETYKELAWP
jgi:hypothetical protein